MAKSQNFARQVAHWMTWNAAGNSQKELTEIEKRFVLSSSEISGIGIRKLHFFAIFFKRRNSIQRWLNSIAAQRIPKTAEGIRYGR